MTKWVVVYIEGVSYLCKWYGDHYEKEAQGDTMALLNIATMLNSIK